MFSSFIKTSIYFKVLIKGSPIKIKASAVQDHFFIIKMVHKPTCRAKCEVKVKEIMTVLKIVFI